MTVRTSGIAASVRLGIKDEVRALDIDNAASLRLLQFDTDVMKQSARLIAYEVSKIFGSGESDDDGEKYSTENAESW